MEHNDKLPDFFLPATDGNNYTHNFFNESKCLAIVFMCNHCPYVHKYIDRIIQVNNQYDDEDFKLMAINSNDQILYPQDSFENMKKYAEQKGFKFPYLYDETQEVAKRFDAKRTPEVFLFNERKELVYRGAIDDNCDDPKLVTKYYLQSAIDAILIHEQITETETRAVGCSIKWKL